MFLKTCALSMIIALLAPNVAGASKTFVDAIVENMEGNVFVETTHDGLTQKIITLHVGDYTYSFSQSTLPSLGKEVCILFRRDVGDNLVLQYVDVECDQKVDTQSIVKVDTREIIGSVPVNPKGQARYKNLLREYAPFVRTAQQYSHLLHDDGPISSDLEEESQRFLFLSTKIINSTSATFVKEKGSIFFISSRTNTRWLSLGVVHDEDAPSVVCVITEKAPHKPTQALR